MIEFLNESQFAQPIYSAGILILAFILYFVIKLIINKIILKITAKTKTDLDDKIVLSFKRHSKNIKYCKIRMMRVFRK